MDFRLTEKEEKLRNEVQEFVKQELPEGWVGLTDWDTEEDWAFTRHMARRLASRGWLTISWPREYGGLGGTHTESVVYKEEVSYHRVPGVDMGIGGVTWVGPSLMKFGTEEQKKEHLPPIAAGERFWCTGYSEPESGSDLASLKLRAVEDGSDFILNGQKVWTSAGHRAHWCWLAARTDPDAPKHRGISVFLVDMKTPGVEVRPLIKMEGVREFCEIFFDNVRVPRSSLVGEKNRGWYYVVYALDFERTTGIRHVAQAKRLADDLVGYLREVKGQGRFLRNEPYIRQRLAQALVECEVGRTLCYRIADMLEKGQVPNYEASMVKNFGSELAKRIANLGMQILGLYGQLDGHSQRAPLKGAVEHLYMAVLGGTIAAGTSEINRNIIAQRGLGLPR